MLPVTKSPFREKGHPHRSEVAFGPETRVLHAVRGFFENGGHRSFIARVTGNEAVALD